MDGKCLHEKVYSDILDVSGERPLAPWICRKCLAEGADPVSTFRATEYETLRAKINRAKPAF